MDLFNFFQYEFVQKAVIAGSFTAIACAVLGVFLVLKKMSLIGDGLSHLSFAGIALGLLLGVYPFYVAIPVTVVGAFLINKITEKTKVYGDAAIGIVSAVGISAGVVIASLAKGFNVDLFSYLFGNILAISNSEVVVSIILSAVILIVVYKLYWPLFSTTFDEDYATANGVDTKRMNLILTILTALTVALSIKVVGIMLVSALLVLPAVTALQVAKSFKMTIYYSLIVAVVSVLLGVILSFWFDLPSGATVVLVNATLFCIALIMRKIRG